MGNVQERRLCRPACDHFSATWLDQGWACGYKNFQMLLSSLSNDPKYCERLFGHPPKSNAVIPSVSHLQSLIERAWNAGFDSEGREQLNGSLHNSTKWIGPTEIVACLANLNIKCVCSSRSKNEQRTFFSEKFLLELNYSIFISRKHFTNPLHMNIYSNGFELIFNRRRIFFIHSICNTKVTMNDSSLLSQLS